MLLKSAADLKPSDPNGLSDPYAMLKLGKKALKPSKSSVQKKTLNPAWGEAFKSADGALGELAAQPLHLKMMDKDAGPTDQKLGTLEASLAGLREKDALDFEAQPLSGVPTGTVTFAVRWIQAV